MSRPAARRAALSLTAGLAAALAFPPFGLLPGVLGYGGLMLLLDGADAIRPLRSAFWRGWLAGTAFFALGVWWVSEAFMVDVAAHGWQAPFAVAFLAAGLGLFWGAAGAAYHRLAPSGPWRAAVFAAVFALTEWLRGHVLTGFPWNLPGEVWKAGSAMSQFASVSGAYGLGALTLLIAGLGAMGLRDVASAPRDLRLWRGPGLALLLIAGLWTYGALRLNGADAAPPSGPLIRVVQANVPQTDKWDIRSFTDILDRYTRLTAQMPKEGSRPDIIIWSETAIPALVDEYLAPGTWTRQRVEDALLPGQVLILGADREEPSRGGGRRDYNSLLVVRRDPAGLTLLSTYDKHHLVPFGEYFPVENVATALGLKALVHVGDGFTAGPAAQVQHPPGIPALAPMICYESLFPLAVSGRSGRARWIVNISNDAWFGRTSGPLQHFNLARYRAIEDGLPMARATPTGVSAMVDAYGRPLALLGMGAEGVIDRRLSAATAPTPYRVWGDSLFWLLVLAGLAPGLCTLGVAPIVAGVGFRRSASS